MKFPSQLLLINLHIATLVMTPIVNASPLPDPLKSGWEGKSVCEKLHEDLKQRVLRCTFAPGVGHERHFHAANFGYALSGGLVQITDSKGVREYEIKVGSSRMSLGTEWHEIVNIGKTTVVYLIVEPKG